MRLAFGKCMREIHGGGMGDSWMGDGWMGDGWMGDGWMGDGWMGDGWMGGARNRAACASPL
jgi:hypothetical protein